MSGTESKRLYARQDVEQSFRLISAVEKRPVVYNKKLKHYKNKVSQNDAWSSIAVEVRDDTPSPSIPARTPANPQRKRRRINEGSEVSEVLKELMEATVANANSPENTSGRWVAEFLRRFTPEEQQEVTSRIQRAMLEAEDDVKAKRQAM
ncbi:uncharacterized protein LOC131285212 [Anopheles ziemanni]|uniref:uncharacterized protein LOC131264851 n=1 Tax=Anopheles coustani TaxID=139045 RepID=UPI00265A472E|nr:uncharacterized protein LOC131264851 [Anopheles coustani]XP_058170055.1 uncharacterized protein LOC131285212 [Anopheles ziemanni]